MVEIPKDEYEELQTLRKIINDPELLQQFLESEKAIKEGRTKSWKEVRKDL